MLLTRDILVSRQYLHVLPGDLFYILFFIPYWAQINQIFLLFLNDGNALDTFCFKVFLIKQLLKVIKV